MALTAIVILLVGFCVRGFFGKLETKLNVVAVSENGETVCYVKKVERSHRKDNEYFYATHRFYSFEDFRQQLAVYNRNYNNFPMRPLNWLPPKQYVLDYIHHGLLH